MRLGEWFFIGQTARDIYRLARQCAHEQSKRTRLRELQTATQHALEESRRKHREKITDCEQLKGILSVVAPDRLAEWKQQRKAERSVFYADASGASRVVERRASRGEA